MGLMDGFLRRTLFPMRFVVEDGGGAGAAGGAQGSGEGDGSAGAGDAGKGGKGGAGYPAGREGLFTQGDVDAAVSKRLELFAGVDVDEYRALKSEKAKREREVLEKRGEFDKILAQTVKEKDDVIGSKDEEIASLVDQLKKIRVDNALLGAASAARAIKPGQIVMLLKGNVHYDRKSDSVEVRESGAPLYKGGKPVSVDEYVQGFLASNPHFVLAGPGGSGAAGGTAGQVSGSAYKIGAADAKDPAKYRAAKEAAAKAGLQLVIER
ncbi:hypothetical protein [Chlorobium phaeobacteroides]|uniref:Uncharacterized protein n=1 Tax=Chlorobium phaeobacteroides (strain DSM 266 / SMG 266 / 2430) TaxID=290317 RepID=A1BGV7_CHLPD|nr:hypothetical protein [Chlorobium phaeobacteroides]ABL65634.1 hypothetical protein Cpha266_1613 [Chlorobium phaeobacteroides DSM 266]